MASPAYTSDQPIVAPTIRADLPKTVVVSPDLRDGLIVALGCVIAALTGIAAASYMMLPFGVG